MNIHDAHVFNQIDKGFNIVGSMPVVGFFSGSIRAVAYKIVMLVGAVITTIGLIGYLASEKQKWREFTQLGKEFLLHGALNCLRGYVEASLAFFTYGLGNLVLLIPNLAKQEPFSPFIPWGTFSHRNQRVVYA